MEKPYNIFINRMPSIVMHFGEYAIEKGYTKGTMKMKTPYGNRSKAWEIKDGEAIIYCSPTIFKKTGVYIFSLKVMDKEQILYSSPVKVHFNKISGEIKAV